MKYAFLASLLLLGGCGQDFNDLRKFVADTKAQSIPFNEPELIYPQLELVPYQVAQLRSPFSPPERKDGLKMSERSDCPRPDFSRKLGLLETYALDSFTLKGVMTDSQGIWALMLAGDGKIYSVKRGDYLGLFHGEVKQINTQGIVIGEWYPDGLGCWQQKETQLALVLEQK